jgi:RNA polymerase sigma-70 factor (ECF subfamily)
MSFASDTIEIQDLLKTSTEKAFERIYELYYESLCNVSYKLVLDKDSAEDVVQEVLLEFYNKRNEINITSSIFAYLKRAVYNRSLNFIKQNSKNTDGEDALIDISTGLRSVEENMISDEGLTNINRIVETLPEKCRYVFALSRYEEKSYAEIAEIMDISVKTVENQISKALKVLREALVNR